jgi:hypothetical protein
LELAGAIEACETGEKVVVKEKAGQPQLTRRGAAWEMPNGAVAALLFNPYL